MDLRMKEKIIGTVADYELVKKSFASPSFIFRGVPDSSYELVPSLYRGLGGENWKEDDDKSIREMEKVFWKEDDIFHMFLEDANLTGEELSLSHLCKLQHYGVATRLLDFTKDIDISLAFALCDFYTGEPCDNEKDAAIYVLDKNKFADLETNDRELLAELIYKYNDDDCLSIECDGQKANYPLKPTYFELDDDEDFPRIRKQKGCFILFPHAFDENRRIGEKDIECKIVLKKEIKDALRESMKFGMESLK